LTLSEYVRTSTYEDEI